MKKGKINKFLSWLFEEDEDEKSEEDFIQINAVQFFMVVIVTALFLFFYFYGFLKSYFSMPIFDAKETIEKTIEKNYFKNKKLENGDFSQGLKHWATSDGGDLFPKSQSKAFIEKNDFHSAPFSLKIKSVHPANRYHYSKKANTEVINNAYSYKEPDHWMGILPGSKVRVGMWYKGDVVAISAICLHEDGYTWSKIAYAAGDRAEKWRQLKSQGEVPPDGRAVAIEITINRAEDMPPPVVLIDDVVLEVTANKKSNNESKYNFN